MLWFGHVVRWNGSSANMILNGQTDGRLKEKGHTKFTNQELDQQCHAWTESSFKQIIKRAKDRYLGRPTISLPYSSYRKW